MLTPTLPRNRWLLFSVLWLATILYQLLQESSGGTAPFPHFDKIAHFAIFFAQFWLLSKIWLNERRNIPIRGLVIAAVCLAAATEIAQALFTNTRQGDWLDAIADIAGATTALWLAQKVQNARRNIQTSHHRKTR